MCCLLIGESSRIKQSLEKRLSIARPPDVSYTSSLSLSHDMCLMLQVLRLHLKRFRYVIIPSSPVIPPSHISSQMEW